MSRSSPPLAHTEGPAWIWVDPSVAASVREALSEHYLVRDLNREAPPRRGVVIVRGGASAEALAQEQIQVAVVALVAREDLVGLPTSVADIVLPPHDPTEVAARVRRLLAQGTPGYRVQLVARAVEYAGDIIELATSEAKLQYVNPAYSKVLGYSLSEVEGHTPAQLVRSEHHCREFFDAIDETLHSGRVWSGELISKSAHGTLVHLETTLAPVVNQQGRVTHHIGVKRDVTERVLREQTLREKNRELLRARDAAVRADKTKSEFLANVSHELRTPLSAIIGYADLQAEEAQEQGNVALAEDLKRIRGSGERLLRLINDVLDMSKLESGRMDCSIEAVDLEAIAVDAVDSVRPQALERKNHLLVRLAGAPHVQADPQKLTQVLINLLSNACKFTTDGTIELQAVAAPGGRVEISVSDTGIGMSPGELDRIFLPFVQVDSSARRSFGGTGLGLAISRQYCELMSGHLNVTSQPGLGSCFTVDLPAA